MSSVKVANAGMLLEGEGEGCQVEGRKKKPRNQRKGDSDGLNSHQEPDRLHVLVPCLKLFEIGSGFFRSWPHRPGDKVTSMSWARARSSWRSAGEVV